MTNPVERLADAVNGNPALVRRGQHLDTSFMLEVGDERYLVSIRRGRVESVTRGPFVMPRCDFLLRASADEWAVFWQDVPPPGHHDVMALIKRRALSLEGDTYPFMANLFYFKALLASARRNPSLDSVAPLAVSADAAHAMAVPRAVPAPVVTGAPR